MTNIGIGLGVNRQSGKGAAASFRDVVSTLEPTMWWGLHEASGTFEDLSGNGNDADIVTLTEVTRGEPSIVPGDTESTAGSLLARRLELQRNNLFGTTTPPNGYTLSSWSRPTALNTGISGSWHQGTSGGTPSVGFGTSDANKNKFRIGALVGSNRFWQHTEDIVAETLYHVVMRIISGQQQITVNGVELFADTFTGALSIDDWGLSNTLTNLAAAHQQHLMAWDRYLSDDEVAQLYSAGIA